MGNNKNPNQKRPGEKEPGTFHSNPGNQSGKTVEVGKPSAGEKDKIDQNQSAREQQDQKH